MLPLYYSIDQNHTLTLETMEAINGMPSISIDQNHTTLALETNEAMNSVLG